MIHLRANGSLDYSPITHKPIDENIIHHLRLCLNKALNYQIGAKLDEKVENHCIMLDTYDPDNKYEIIETLRDERSISKLQYVINFKDQLYLTPYFFKHFDHELI